MNKDRLLSNIAGTVAPLLFSPILWYFGIPFLGCTVISIGYWVWWFFIVSQDEDPYEGI